MAFNFADIIDAETKKAEAAATTGGNGGGLGFKTVYPFSNGRLEFKFIGNEPSGTLYRELTFHEYWSDKDKQTTPCLYHMYGLDCPICNAVSNIQNTLDDRNVFGKYGFKKRGIMFAKLVNFAPENYFGDTRNPPKAGDVVLFMFPKSVISELRNLIIEFQDELENIFIKNESRVVTLKIATQANGFPQYTFYVKGNSVPLCIDTAGNPDEVAYMEYMKNMPNLNEVRYPSTPNEDMMNIHRTVVEEINRSYFGDMVGTTMPNPTQMASNPTPTETPTYNVNTTPVNSMPVQNAPKIETPVAPSVAPTPTINTTPVANTSTVTNTVPEVPIDAPDEARDISVLNTNKPERPPCFGNNEYNDKCAACPWDNECV